MDDTPEPRRGRVAAEVDRQVHRSSTLVAASRRLRQDTAAQLSVARVHAADSPVASKSLNAARSSAVIGARLAARR